MILRMFTLTPDVAVFEGLLSEDGFKDSRDRETG